MIIIIIGIIICTSNNSAVAVVVLVFVLAILRIWRMKRLVWKPKLMETTYGIKQWALKSVFIMGN